MWNTGFHSLWLVSLEQVQTCRPHAIYSCLSIFFFSVRRWNGSPDIRLQCNFYFIRNLQFHIFPNGITWIIYISGNNLSINHSDSEVRAHRKDRDESKSCFIIRSSFLKILTFIGLKSETVWDWFAVQSFIFITWDLEKLLLESCSCTIP